MNLLELLARSCLSVGLSSLVAIVISSCVFGICWLLVYLFELNYNRDAYWVLNVTLATLYISWVISLAYFMTVLK